MLTPSQFPGFPHRNGALYPQQILGALRIGVLSSPLCEQDASPGDPPGSGVLALQQTLGAPQRGCPPPWAVGIPPEVTPHYGTVSPNGQCPVWTYPFGTKVGASPLTCWMCPSQQRSCKLGHPVPPAWDPGTPPWAALTLASGGNGADRHPLPCAFPMEPWDKPEPLHHSALSVGVWGPWAIACRGQGPPQPTGSLPHGHSIWVLITGRFPLQSTLVMLPWAFTALPCACGQGSTSLF